MAEQGVKHMKTIANEYELRERNRRKYWQFAVPVEEVEGE